MRSRGQIVRRYNQALKANNNIHPGFETTCKFKIPLLFQLMIKLVLSLQNFNLTSLDHYNITKTNLLLNIKTLLVTNISLINTNEPTYTLKTFIT